MSSLLRWLAPALFVLLGGCVLDWTAPGDQDAGDLNGATSDAGDGDGDGDGDGEGGGPGDGDGDGDGDVILDAGSDAMLPVACPTGDCGPCEASPCLHGGTCLRVGDDRQCTCEPPWYGVSCEKNDDAALAALEVTAGALWPPFDPDVTEYTVDLGLGEGTIAVIPMARVPEGASIRVEGDNLESGEASAPKSIAVNATDGFSIAVSTNTDARVEYSVTVRRSLVQRYYVKADTSSPSEAGFGTAVAMDEQDIAVGIPGAHYMATMGAGAVRIVRREGRSLRLGQWIWAPTPVAAARFGERLALSGDHLVISAPGEDNGDSQSDGAIYIYERDDNGAFVNVARFTDSRPSSHAFGSTIALSGNVLLATAGEQRVFVIRHNGGTWATEDVLESNATEGSFGSALATDGTWAAVSDLPAVHLYRYTPGMPDWAYHGALAPELAEETLFGGGLSFHDDTLVVASMFACLFGCNGVPSLYTFAREGTDWTRVHRFPMPHAPDIPSAARASFFGFDLAFDGRTLLSSARGESLAAREILGRIPIEITETASASGAAYAFSVDDSGISLTAYMKASNAEPEDQFGTAAAMADGLIAIGAPAEDSSSGGVSAQAAEDNGTLNSGALYVLGTDCSLVHAEAPVPGCH